LPSTTLDTETAEKVPLLPKIITLKRDALKINLEKSLEARGTFRARSLSKLMRGGA